MAVRFEGSSDLKWKLFEDLLPQPPEKRGRGMPHVPFRKVLNTQLYVLITSCRWCDIPTGEQWASKNSAHRWLKRWYEKRTLEKLKERILAMAKEKGIIDWKYGAVDGSVSPWERWRSRLRHYLARLHRQSFCYSKSIEMLATSIRLLIYYLKHRQIPSLR